MDYNGMIDNLKTPNLENYRLASRKIWPSNIFIKYVTDAVTQRGNFGVALKPFFAKSNPDNYEMEIYYPTKEDISATDWRTLY